MRVCVCSLHTLQVLSMSCLPASVHGPLPPYISRMKLHSLSAQISICSGSAYVNLTFPVYKLAAHYNVYVNGDYTCEVTDRMPDIHVARQNIYYGQSRWPKASSMSNALWPQCCMLLATASAALWFKNGHCRYADLMGLIHHFGAYPCRMLFRLAASCIHGTQLRCDAPVSYCVDYPTHARCAILKASPIAQFCTGVHTCIVSCCAHASAGHGIRVFSRGASRKGRVAGLSQIACGNLPSFTKEHADT